MLRVYFVFFFLFIIVSFLITPSSSASSQLVGYRRSMRTFLTWNCFFSLFYSDRFGLRTYFSRLFTRRFCLLFLPSLFFFFVSIVIVVVYGAKCMSTFVCFHTFGAFIWLCTMFYSFFLWLRRNGRNEHETWLWLKSNCSVLLFFFSVFLFTSCKMSQTTRDDYSSILYTYLFSWSCYFARFICLLVWLTLTA